MLLWQHGSHYSSALSHVRSPGMASPLASITHPGYWPVLAQYRVVLWVLLLWFKSINICRIGFCQSHSHPTNLTWKWCAGGSCGDDIVTIFYHGKHLKWQERLWLPFPPVPTTHCTSFAAKANYTLLAALVSVDWYIQDTWTLFLPVSCAGSHGGALGFCYTGTANVLAELHGMGLPCT